MKPSDCAISRFLGVVMPSTRSRKPAAAAAAATSAATQEPPVTPIAPTRKRQRKPPAQFEAGKNPSPSTSRRRPQNKRTRVEPEPEPRAAAPIKASQFAAEIQAEDITGEGGDHEDAEIADSGDPCPEDEVVEVADDGVSWDDFEAVASVRYRACLGDIAKHPLVASDSYMGQKVSSMDLWELWEWVDKVLVNLRPRKVSVQSVTAVVYPNKQPKSDRRQKTIRRGEYLVWDEFQELAKQVDFRTSEELNIDFDVVLSELREPATSQPATPQQYSRPVTATMIQERGLAAVLEVEKAASGKLLALQDRWRCVDAHCGNNGKYCWLPQLGGRVARFEDHHPMTSNNITNWLEDEEKGLCTIDQPSDRVRMALFSQKREFRRVEKPPTLSESLQQMQQIMLMGQLQQMSSNLPTITPQSKSQPTSTGVVAEPDRPPTWQPIETKDWVEINLHTRNFLTYFKHRWYRDTVDEIKEKVLTTARLNINHMMEESENGITMGMWVNHFHLQPGDLLQLRQEAVKWQQQYKGLGQRQQAQVDRVVEARARQADDDGSDDGVLSEI